MEELLHHLSFVGLQVVVEEVDLEVLWLLVEGEEVESIEVLKVVVEEVEQLAILIYLEVVGEEAGESKYLVFQSIII